MNREYYGEENINVKTISSKGEELVTKSVVIEDTLLSMVDAGLVFTGSADIESVASDESVYLLIEVGSKPIHLVLELLSVGQWRFESFINPTITDNGTAIAPFNRRGDSLNTLESILYQGATITDEGTARLSFRYGSGDLASRVTTAEQRDDIVSVFGANSKFLMKLTNESNVSSYLSVIGDFYEEQL